jgi:hypothetical protein
MLHHAPRRLDGEPAWHEIVPGIAVGDIDDVPRDAELLHRLLQDDLHRVE